MARAPFGGADTLAQKQNARVALWATGCGLNGCDGRQSVTMPSRWASAT